MTLDHDKLKSPLARHGITVAGVLLGASLTFHAAIFAVGLGSGSALADAVTAPPSTCALLLPDAPLNPTR